VTKIEQDLGLRGGSGLTPRLADLVAQATEGRRRPVEGWNPPFCGEIGISIDGQGRWSYLGSPIERAGLVALFASILRREGDGHHYLVTPVEKVRIAVADAPFIAVEMRVEGSGEDRVVGFRTNLDAWAIAGSDHPLRFAVEPGTGGLKPYVALDRGLEALVSRPLVYDLLELAEERELGGQPALGVVSGGRFFPIPPAADPP